MGNFAIMIGMSQKSEIEIFITVETLCDVFYPNEFLIPYVSIEANCWLTFKTPKCNIISLWHLYVLEIDLELIQVCI